MLSDLILKNQQRLDLKILKRSECQIKPRLILSLSSIRKLNSAPKRVRAKLLLDDKNK